MSDLIDWASPDNNKVSAPKLSSPLIPLPINNCIEPTQTTSIVNLECQQSIDNPFDMELQKINEFISKSEDPFEVVWQKAINTEDNYESRGDNHKPSSSSIDFNDDQCYKHKKNTDRLKMNKTLDESFIGVSKSVLAKNQQKNSTINSKNVTSHSDQLNKFMDNVESLKRRKSKSNDNLPLLKLDPPSSDSNNLSILNQSIINDSFLLFSPTGRPNTNTGRPFNLLSSGTLNPSNSREAINQLNSSILNQSAMNDSLSGSNSSDNGLIKSIVAQRIATCIQKGIIQAKTEASISNERGHKLRRSFSQGDQLSLNNINSNRQIHSQSTIVDNKTKNSSNYPLSSMLYEDPFNIAFEASSSREKATISDISSISSMRRINSFASGVSSVDNANDKTNNCGFIEDNSSLSSCKTSNIKQSNNINRHYSTTTSLAEISDLVAQYDRLKLKSLRDPLNTQFSLVDLSKENSVEQQKIQHDISTDSVFLENNPVTQSISVENSLEKTIGKCKSKSHCKFDSSGDDYLPKRPPSTMDLLADIELPQLSDNKVIVDNLIELQTSNSNNEQTDSIGNNTSQCMKVTDDNNKNNNNNNNNNDNHNDAKTKNVIEEFEKESIEPDKKFTAAVLLMELEKLVNSDKNPKAVELLENLEQVLGVKCHNNCELLEMYIHNTPDSVKNIENNSVGEETKIPQLNTSTEENTNISGDSHKKLSCENFNVDDNNINTDDAMKESEQLEKVSGDYVTSVDNSTKDNLNCQLNESPSKTNSFNAQKLVVDIQIALQKLLINNNSDPTAFLENLNKVLNPSANASEVEESKIDRSNASSMQAIPTSPMKKSDSSCSSNKSTPLRRSGQSLSALKKPIGLQRHSSVSQITNTSIEHNSKIKSRIDSPKKTINKRPSSDSESVNDKLIKQTGLNSIKLKSSVPIIKMNKFRKNVNENTAEMAKKKGPLKAIIPLGNMQRRKSSGKKTSVTTPPLTPPHVKVNAPLRGASTPIPDNSINIECLKMSPKRKPVASSTPDINTKISRSKLLVPKSPKHNMSWNISPVTPSASSKNSSMNNYLSVKNNDSMKRLSQTNKSFGQSSKLKSRSSMRVERTPEDKNKNSSLPRGLSDSKSKNLRRSEPVKRTITAVTELFKKTGKSPTANTLKENNTPGKKVKPVNLISKFQGRSSSVTTMEKENKWK